MPRLGERVSVVESRQARVSQDLSEIKDALRAQDAKLDAIRLEVGDNRVGALEAELDALKTQVNQSAWTATALSTCAAILATILLRNLLSRDWWGSQLIGRRNGGNTSE